jgi:ribosome-associated toxin RatA of RatAB toxin-antitoxin module
MNTFADHVLIAAPADALFALTQDYTRRLEWDPFLSRAELVGGAREAGPGVRALCVARTGLAMETEYVSFNPPGVCAIRMTRGPWFLREFAGSWRFREVEPGRTEVAFTYHLVARPRFLTPLLRRVFARDTRKRLLGLKLAVEEGGLLSRHPVHPEGS